MIVCFAFCIYLPLTQFVEMSLRAVFLQDRTHHPGLEEGGPLVHQAALPSNVILQPAVEKNNKKKTRQLQKKPKTVKS